MCSVPVSGVICTIPFRGVRFSIPDGAVPNIRARLSPVGGGGQELYCTCERLGALYL